MPSHVGVVRARRLLPIVPENMSDGHPTLIEQLLRHNADHAAAHRFSGLSPEPAKRVAVVACMDTRLDVLGALGLEVGDAHVIRNAGGIVTDDVVRSLVLSQRRLGTTAIVLLHHTKCGVEGLDDAELRRELVFDVGRAPDWQPGGFDDAVADAAESVARLRACPYLPARDDIRGFVYDVDTGRLVESLDP